MIDSEELSSDDVMEVAELLGTVVDGKTRCLGQAALLTTYLCASGCVNPTTVTPEQVQWFIAEGSLALARILQMMTPPTGTMH